MEDDERVGAGGIIGLMMTIAVAAGLCIFNSLRNPFGLVDLTGASLGEIVAYIGGQATVIGVAVFAVFFLVYLRRTAEQKTLTFLLITIVTVFVIDFGVFSLFSFGVQALDRQAREQQAMMAEITHAMSIAADPSAGPIDMRIKSSGEFGEMERLVKNEAQSIRAASTRYRDALKAEDYPGFLKPARLAADRGLAHTRAHLKALHAALAGYRSDMTAIIAAFRAALTKAKLSDEARGSVLRGLNGSLAESSPVRDRILACADEIFTEFDGIAALLAHPHGRWMVSNGRLLFSDQRDLDGYNAHIVQVRNLEAEQGELRAQEQEQLLRHGIVLTH